MYLQSGKNRQTCDKFPLFAALNFNLTGNKLSLLLKWDPKEYLRHPLLNLHPLMSDQAMKANKLILDFMEKSTDEGDNVKKCEISEIDILQVSVLVEMGCEKPNEYGIEIRDEIYCQLIKQTTCNVNRRSCFRGYQLLLSCLAGFPPSDALAPFLLSHLHIGCHGGAMLSRRTVKLAEYCLRALEMVQKLGARKWGLTRSEIVTIISGNCTLTVAVWLTRDFAVDIIVDSWTTIKELKIAACEKVDIQETSIFTISATTSSVDELDKQGDSDILASSRGLMRALYDQLYHHYLILTADTSDGMKGGGIKSLFGKTKCLHTCLSDRALQALDSFLQVELLAESCGFGYAFNESDNCLQVDREEPCQAARKFPMMPLLYIKKCLVTPALSININLKLDLIVWIFPPTGSCEDVAKKTINNVPPDEEEFFGERVTTYDEFDESQDIHNFGSLSLRGIDARRNLPTRKQTHWPHDEAARNVLFAQVAAAIADGTLECADNTETLRLAAFVFAEQHQVIIVDFKLLSFCFMHILSTEVYIHYHYHLYLLSA